MTKKTFWIMVLVLAGMFWYPGIVSANLRIDLRVKPSQVNMGLSYDGTDISISGYIPSDTEAFVRVIGESEHQKLKKKGRALGLLWMNMGAVTIDNAPSVFLLYPSKALAALEQNHPEKWQSLGLGFEALKGRLEILPPTENRDALFDEFVKLKGTEDLYSTTPDAIRYAEKGDGMKSFTCVAALPSDLPEGQLTIEAVAIKDGGTIVARGTVRIRAKETGITATLSSLAFNHGTLYGALAVLVALFAGLVTGLFFKGGKGAH